MNEKLSSGEWTYLGSYRLSGTTGQVKLVTYQSPPDGVRVLGDAVKFIRVGD